MQDKHKKKNKQFFIFIDVSGPVEDKPIRAKEKSVYSLHIPFKYRATCVGDFAKRCRPTKAGKFTLGMCCRPAKKMCSRGF
jgi:hypothetical protein